MNFLKKLFSSKKEDKKAAENSTSQQQSSGERYIETVMDPGTLSGSIKLIESYFVDNQISPDGTTPSHHPINLDRVVNEGMGFQLYCKAFEMEDSQTIGILAMCFSAYIMTEFPFKTYKDQNPEHPLRSMTLKFAKGEAQIALYPYEYALKVLEFEATFEELYLKLKSAIESLPITTYTKSNK